MEAFVVFNSIGDIAALREPARETPVVKQTRKMITQVKIVHFINAHHLCPL